jgi:hypothetical protein
MGRLWWPSTFHSADTALTLGRAVAGLAARVKARNIGREERKADRDADTPRLREEHVTALVFLLGKQSGCCPMRMASCGPLTVTSLPIRLVWSAIERWCTRLIHR